MATILKETTALRGLRCRACSALQPADERYVCGECLGPIEPEYDLSVFETETLRADIESGPQSLWRYAPLLPVAAPATHWPVGWTPLTRADRLGRALGIERLYLKDDTRNPTLSFKDRPVSVALARALELGLDTIACASTGNLAGAVAAAAARNGLRAFVFVPADNRARKDRERGGVRRDGRSREGLV
jgi:threonine synthase